MKTPKIIKADDIIAIIYAHPPERTETEKYKSVLMPCSSVDVARRLTVVGSKIPKYPARIVEKDGRYAVVIRLPEQVHKALWDAGLLDFDRWQLTVQQARSLGVPLGKKWKFCYDRWVDRWSKEKAVPKGLSLEQDNRVVGYYYPRVM